MKKEELVSQVAEVLRINNIKKSIVLPKHTFHISDDEGNSKDFSVRRENKQVMYTAKDVQAIINALIAIIIDCVRRGESVNIYGFGTFSAKRRAARMIKHPTTGEMVEVPEHVIPKFTAGHTLKTAAKLCGIDEEEQSTGEYDFEIDDDDFFVDWDDDEDEA